MKKSAIDPNCAKSLGVSARGLVESNHNIQKLVVENSADPLKTSFYVSPMSVRLLGFNIGLGPI